MNLLMHLFLSSCWMAQSFSYEVEVDQPECPAKCLCSNTQEGSIINCSATGLTELPLISEQFSVLTMSLNGISEFGQTWSKQAVPNVHELHLDHNTLTTTAVSRVGLSKTFPDLHNLDLSYNNLDSVPQNLPKSLKTLWLSRNNIKLFLASDFLDLPNLDSLFLEGNAISAIDELSFIIPMPSQDLPLQIVLPNLKSLELSNNSITHISDHSFTRLGQLEAISLASNKLSILTVNTFKGFRSLRYLDLSNNEIKLIRNQTFKQLSSLKVLYLNNNLLDDLPLGMPYLDWADFSGNRIKFVNESVSKKDIYPIEMLNLAKNPLHCDCRLLWLKELWDRREYLVEQSESDSENLIPVCATPKSLEGELWTLLGDDLFTCEKNQHRRNSQNNVQDKDAFAFDDSIPEVSEFDRNYMNIDSDLEEIETIDHADTDNGMSDSVSPQNQLFIQDYVDVTSETPRKKIVLAAKDVYDNSVTVSWRGELTDQVTQFFIRYHVFGQGNTPLFAQVSSDLTHVKLKGLQPQTNYVICLVVPTSDDILPGNVGLDDCIEITTASASYWPMLPMLPINFQALDYHFKVLFCSLMVSCIICGVGLLLYEICSRGISKYSRAKEHNE